MHIEIIFCFHLEIFALFIFIAYSTKYHIFKMKAIISIWLYVSNPDIESVIKHLLPRRRECSVHLIELVTTKAYGVSFGVLAEINFTWLYLKYMKS